MLELFYGNINDYRAEYDEHYEKLSEYRKNKIDKYKQLEDKLRSLTAGVIFENACRELGFEHLINQVVDGEYGKPYFQNNEVYFSISHSGDMVIVGFADTELGVDIQKIKPMKQDIAKRFYTVKEQEYLSSIVGDDERLKYFYRIWALKESYVKCNGKGVSLGLETFSVLNEVEKYSGIMGEYAWGYIKSS